ncbi:class I SAM-dependent methyltransferase [Bradyrhizobium commune]|uniref:Class I SAM-dependent methyltransferase n=1 Tax=Bradyrhizobium commune TaxID=83627 RepID=A0A7S9D310_9BRAD|nr:class I SAM-dependent methyltransferase [Bradyrhizobium commune]QPF90278.1 class I SAM-dependent methyltransferase [Bradyrhizobium commune]
MEFRLWTTTRRAKCEAETMVASIDALRRYVAGDLRKVDGWLSRIDAEILQTVLTAQSASQISGSVAEIGVHHGKAFILLCLGRNNEEAAYCIDIFEDQHLNQDASGHGNRAIFEQNLKNFGISNDRLVIDARSSEIVCADDLLSRVGQVRLFSVDGGHWSSIVINDLALAEATLAPRGVIALDDFHRSEWPNVSDGYFKWFAGRKSPIVPFAIGSNKLYLCPADDVRFYQGALSAVPLLEDIKSKMIEFQEVQVPVYQSFIQTETKRIERVKGYLKAFHPGFFSRLKRLRKRMR